MKQKLAIIGAGISGLSAAHFLKKRYDVHVFEKDKTAGGLIKCRRVNGSLFHTCGGHVFNSKKQDVLDWFWSIFDMEKEFSKTERNSVVFMNNATASTCFTAIPYPIENHVYLFGEEVQKAFIEDLVTIAKQEAVKPRNFEEFLKGRFGETLYNLYFKPYNEKVWRRDLRNVPLEWLEGKLPMPTVQEMIFNNINHVEEKTFVHARFWYENNNGSQFIADKLAEDLNISYSKEIGRVEYHPDIKQWSVENSLFDKVLFCGNIKDMVEIIEGVDLEQYKKPVEELEYHGTTAVFCEIDANPYSWIYQPNQDHDSHRIICTGNFCKTNNGLDVKDGRITATIEFTDEVSYDEIISNLKRIPLHPVYMDHKYNRFTYPIQNNHTRQMITDIKKILEPYGFFFSGRFADWEYYNMDVAIKAAKDTCERL